MCAHTRSRASLKIKRLNSIACFADNSFHNSWHKNHAILYNHAIMDNRQTIKISIKEDDENLRFSGLRIVTL